MSMLPEMLGQLFALLPPWAIPIVVIAIAVVAVPAWFRFVGAKQVRGHLRRAFYAKDPGERARAIDAAFARAGRNAHLLGVLAEDALKHEMKPTWSRAVAALEEVGAHPDDVRRLRSAQTAPQPKRATHPLEEVVIIERMIAADLVGPARERLAEARRRFGDDPDLVALERRLDTPAPGAGTG